MAEASRESELRVEKQTSVQCVINANITMNGNEESFGEIIGECGRHEDKSCGNGISVH
jgi:hypothetical protein